MIQRINTDLHRGLSTNCARLKEAYVLERQLSWWHVLALDYWLITCWKPCCCPSLSELLRPQCTGAVGEHVLTDGAAADPVLNSAACSSAVLLSRGHIEARSSRHCRTSDCPYEHISNSWFIYLLRCVIAECYSSVAH